MRTPRTLLSLLLVALMLVSAVAPFASFADNTTEGNKTTTTSQQLSDEELPDSVTLVGTKHLPPISNQGAIGTCASQSIAYEQMTNAVSRYLHYLNPDIEWNPSSGDLKYLISPKFTYDYSGSGTAWVYNILRYHGAATMEECSFQMNKVTGAYMIFMGGGGGINNQYRKTTAWYIGQNDLLEALKIRLVNWNQETDQVWVRRNSFNDENGNVMITKTEEGKALLNRIKNSLNNGNVVVTGGLSGAWRYDKITKNGDIGKKGEECLSWAHSDQAGGHQVSIVGYDDNVECTINGATMKGAFLVANSWGTSWANDGYIWLMYDALNSKSEFDAINQKYPDRYIAMDQFCFTEWDTDIEIGLPELMVQVEVEAVYREAVAIYLTRHEGSKYETEKPMMFQYGLIGSNYHTDYEVNGAKYTFSGKEAKDGAAAETGYFTIAYKELIESMGEGKSFDDYQWGCRVYSVHGYPIKIKSIKLINSDETVLSEIEIPDGGINLPEKPTNSHSSMSTAVYPVTFDFKHSSVESAESENYEIEYLTETEYIAEGTKVSFKVNAADGYNLGDVSVNGQVVEAKDGVYTFTAAENNVITVAEKAPETTPTPTAPATTPDSTESEDDGSNVTTIVIVVVAAVVVIGGAVVLVVVKKKK